MADGSASIDVGLGPQKHQSDDGVDTDDEPPATSKMLPSSSRPPPPSTQGNANGNNNNNNNNSHDNVYGAVIMTKVIARVHPVHFMNVD